MRILVTRPEADAARLKQLLSERGHATLLSPLTEVHFFDGPEIALDSVQAVILTGANGVRALERRSRQRNATVFAVGPATAEAATAAGFTQVRRGSSDSTALAALVQQTLDPRAGPLLYVRGRDRAGDLDRSLVGAGFQIETVVFYAAERLSLNDAAIDALRAEIVDAVMLFSPRSAQLFGEEVEENRLQDQCSRLVAFCISGAVGGALAPLSFVNICIAREPNMSGMLALLDEVPPC